MSLLLHRRSIHRAVAGGLSVRRQDRLRSHLGGCAACRREYDRLALLAEAAGGRHREAAARARLLAALPVEVGAASAPRQRIPLLILPVLAAAAAALLFLLPRQAAPPEEIRWRGAAAPADDSVRAGLVLRAYASRRASHGGAGPVRLLGELPGSGELRVGRADLLQLAYAGLTAPRHVAVFAVAAATLIPCWPRPAGASLALSPTSEGRPIGRSLEIAALGLDEGARLVAVVSTRALTGPQAESAARASLGGRAPDDDGVAVLTSALIVEP